MLGFKGVFITLPRYECFPLDSCARLGPLWAGNLACTSMEFEMAAQQQLDWYRELLVMARYFRTNRVEHQQFLSAAAAARVNYLRCKAGSAC